MVRLNFENSLDSIVTGTIGTNSNKNANWHWFFIVGCRPKLVTIKTNLTFEIPEARCTFDFSFALCAATGLVTTMTNIYAIMTFIAVATNTADRASVTLGKICLTRRHQTKCREWCRRYIFLRQSHGCRIKLHSPDPFQRLTRYPGNTFKRLDSKKNYIPNMKVNHFIKLGHIIHWHFPVRRVNSNRKFFCLLQLMQTTLDGFSERGPQSAEALALTKHLARKFDIFGCVLDYLLSPCEHSLNQLRDILKCRALCDLSNLNVDFQLFIELNRLNQVQNPRDLPNPVLRKRPKTIMPFFFFFFSQASDGVT